MVWLLLLSELLYSPSEQNDLLVWPLGLFSPLLPGSQAGKTPHVAHQLEERHSTKWVSTHNLLSEQTSFTHLDIFVLLFKNRGLNPSKIPAVHRGVEGWTSHTKARAQNHSEQTRKRCGLSLSDPKQVTDAKRVLKILLFGWQTNSCAPTGHKTSLEKSVALCALTHLLQRESQALKK